MPSLPQITCFGTPYEIGFAHGTQARPAVSRSIAFYTRLFATNCAKTWPQVQHLAAQWLPHIQSRWPDLLDEMAGVADGAGVDLQSIVALNIRTEINYGLFSDGCTALAWHTQDKAFLAQNWDWETPQRENLVLLHIKKDGGPRIAMVTEAGIVGKIGFNEHGVGVCLNAIKMKGMDVSRVPCHLGLRLVLESRSREEAVATLEKTGVASSCHMLVADAAGGVGLEWSSTEGKRIEQNDKGQVFHSNHYVHPDLAGEDAQWLSDSKFRISRIQELCKNLDSPDMESVQKLFRDEENYPGSICRKEQSDSMAETLFNIVMDLSTREAKITFGRPVSPLEQITVRL